MSRPLFTPALSFYKKEPKISQPPTNRKMRARLILPTLQLLTKNNSLEITLKSKSCEV